MALRRFVVAAAVIVPLVSAGIVFVPGAARERWQQMVDWGEQAYREWIARDFAREPLVGENHDGNAARSYAEAVEIAAVLGRDDADLLRQAQTGRGLDDAVVADLVQRWRTPLRVLAEGAHRRDARPAIDWDLGTAHPCIRLLAARDLFAAAAVTARRQVATGHGREAVELLFDCLTFALDLQRSPLFVERMIAAALIGTAADELLRDTELRALDGSLLAMLDAGLARADAHCDVEWDDRGELLLFVRSLLAAYADGGGDASRESPTEGASRSWRYAWSKRWAAADAVLAVVEVGSALRHAAGEAEQAWPERRTQLEAAERDLAGRDNAVIPMVAANRVAVEQVQRTARARLRLLRLAVAEHRGEAIGELGDPLGSGPIAVRRDGPRTVFTAGDEAGTSLVRESERR